jgi:hypothetical protein
VQRVRADPQITRDLRDRPAGLLDDPHSCAVDVAGVAIIVCGALIATGVFAHRLLNRGGDFSAAYRL